MTTTENTPAAPAAVADKPAETAAPPAPKAAETASAPAPPNTEDVTLDLDTLEREGAKGPFTFRHAGREWRLSDPEELDWQELLLALGDYRFFLRVALPTDDREAFFSTYLAAWRLNKLMERYMGHYGMPKAPESAALPA